MVLGELIVLMLVWTAKLILLHRSQPKCPISICLAGFLIICACVHTKLLHLCPTLCDPMDGSPPGSSAHRILQARILEWVAILFSKDIPDLSIEPGSPVLQVEFLPSEPPGKSLMKVETSVNHKFSKNLAYISSSNREQCWFYTTKYWRKKTWYFYHHILESF